jgi:putative tricarboxylic transport membrane protein
MTRRDGLAAAALLVFAAVAAVESLRLLPYGTVRNPGPAFFPWWTSLALVLLSAVLLVRAVRGGAEPRRADEGRWVKVAGLLGALAVYSLVLEPVGYPIATFLLVLFMLRITEPAGWPLALTTAVLAAGGTYLVFAVWLAVPLPPGPFAR